MDIFHKLVDIISNICEIDSSKITMDSNLVSDLEIDSLDFLDIVFAIDKTYGIKLPFEKWMQEINAKQAKQEDYFIVSNLCEKIKEQIRQKPL